MSNHKYTIIDLQKFAKNKGGLCLSERYVNTSSKVEWECSDGHRWLACWNSVCNVKTWCLLCSHNAPKTLKNMQDFAHTKGGECISKSYTNWKTKLRWKCADGHEWDASQNSVQSSGTWCPYCSGSLTESKCRYIFETYLRCDFKRNREVINGFELDGYNCERRLAFEYDGEGHYKFIPSFHRTLKNFKERQRKDSLKTKLCKSNNITLIRIPYFEATTDEKLENFIQQSLIELNFCLSCSFSWSDFYRKNSQLKRLDELAQSRGGQLLSRKYLGVNTKVKWRCQQGHEFMTKPAHVKSGHWCPFCSRNAGPNQRKLLCEI